jgi:hypothetical protein
MRTPIVCHLVHLVKKNMIFLPVHLDFIFTCENGVVRGYENLTTQDLTTQDLTTAMPNLANAP